MPDEWVDKDTGHKIIKLAHRDGINMSFYFNNNPFVGDEMLFCGSGGSLGRKAQMFQVNLNTLKVEQLTNEKYSVHSEIVCAKTSKFFYQVYDSVYSFDIKDRKSKLIYVFHTGQRGNIVTVNSDGTLLAGVFDSPVDGLIFRKYPEKHDFFNRIFEAKLPHTLFTINVNTGELTSIYTENAWLNHLQFSPVNPNLLMFCHEGPWDKVDRIWTMDVTKKDKPQLMHQRTMPMEIAGHEWFGLKGKDIYFDLQKPRGKKFFVGKVNLNTNRETDYELQRNEWSVHYTTSWKENLMAGDGGDPNAVAKAKDGKWIYLFHIDCKKLKSTKLVNLKNHNYHLEPNVHFSPDGKWIIFRANFEGKENIYAVEI